MTENETGSFVGRLLDGRYRVESRIGSGGMGDVYLAVHEMLGSRVALKVLASERTQQPDAARRFVREAKSAFRIDHPHCVRVTDLGADGDALFIVMEYLDGRTVGTELAVDGPMDGGRVAHIGAQTARAVAHAHGLGLVHRDLKPDNLMLVNRDGDADYVKVLDFGLARVFDEHGDLAGTAVSISPLTKDGMIFGTPLYMSPEQASGAAVGPKSDIYSLGAVLYHMVTGQELFTGGHFMDVLTRHVRESPIPPSQRCPDLAIDPGLEAVILRCLEKQQDQRPGHAEELAEQLESLNLRSMPRQASEPGPAVAGVETMALSAGLEKASPPAPASTDEIQQWVEGRRPWKLLVAGAVLAAVTLLLVIKLSGGGESAPATAVAPIAGADGGQETAPKPTDPPIGSRAILASVALDAGNAPADAAPLPTRKSSDSPTKSPKQQKTDAHIQAAEAARKSGNVLRQMAEADAARALSPGNRQARRLLGEALVKSGDPGRGCPLLKGTSLHRRMGCAD